MRYNSSIALSVEHNIEKNKIAYLYGDEKRSGFMTKFITNVNKYLSEMKIKQNYLSMITGIDKNKMSRLLTGSQEESGTDMEIIARGLGKSIEFFLADSISVPQVGSFSMNKIAFYAGNPSHKQEQIARQLMELMENMDEVLSAKSRFGNIAEDYE